LKEFGKFTKAFLDGNKDYLKKDEDRLVKHKICEKPRSSLRRWRRKARMMNFDPYGHFLYVIDAIDMLH